MTIRFDDRVAIVTGAGLGLGRAYALALGARGARVVVNDLGGAVDGSGGSATPADAVVEAIRAAGGTAVACYDSVADRAGAARIVEAARDSFGSVDIVINNAGVLRDKTFHKMTLDDFEFVLQVHLLGAAYVTHAAFPVMRDQAYGRILMVSSGSGLYGNFGQSNYAAAKMGVVGLMHALKLEGAKYNIGANALAPMAVTRMTEGAGVFDGYVNDAAGPAPVASMATWLVSEDCTASGYVVVACGGYYSVIRVLEGEGVKFDQAKLMTPEEIAELWPQIADMSHSNYYDDAGENLRAAFARP